MSVAAKQVEEVENITKQRRTAENTNHGGEVYQGGTGESTQEILDDENKKKTTDSTYKYNSSDRLRNAAVLNNFYRNKHNALLPAVALLSSIVNDQKAKNLRRNLGLRAGEEIKI